MALDAMDKRTSNVLVLDADNILLSDTVERFVSLFLEKQLPYRERNFHSSDTGLPISKSNLEA